MIYTRSFDKPTRNPDGGMTFKLTTPGVKRDGMALNMRMFRLSNFQRNPMMLWQHGMDPNRGSVPIGRWEDVSITEHGVTALAVFDSDDPRDEFPDIVRSKYERGFLSAVSIGWLPEVDEDGAARSYDLLEASAVAVPADPEALAEGRALTLTTAEHTSLIERIETLESTIRRAEIRASLTNIL